MMRSFFSVILFVLISGSVSAEPITLYTPLAGDATFAWNSKYGPSGYGVGDTSMGVGLYFGAPYGNDYTVSIFEVPLSAIAGRTVTGATLQVVSLGFSTGYYYGSADIGWLNTGTAILTGDVVADALGPTSTARPGGLTIYNSDYGDTPGLKSFDVLTYVLADLAAGCSYSTFVMSGSRDTYGSIYTAENGNGPCIVANVVPEPGTLALLVMAGLGLLAYAWRRRGA